MPLFNYSTGFIHEASLGEFSWIPDDGDVGVGKRWRIFIEPWPLRDVIKTRQLVNHVVIGVNILASFHKGLQQSQVIPLLVIPSILAVEMHNHDSEFLCPGVSSDSSLVHGDVLIVIDQLSVHCGHIMRACKYVARADSISTTHNGGSIWFLGNYLDSEP